MMAARVTKPMSGRQLVVSRGDAAEVLDAAEEALDTVSLLAQDPIIGALSLAMAAGRHDGIAALLENLQIESIGVIGLVGQDLLGG
jgi:hypothetical protein